MAHTTDNYFSFIYTIIKLAIISHWTSLRFYFVLIIFVYFTNVTDMSTFHTFSSFSLSIWIHKVSKRQLLVVHWTDNASSPSFIHGPGSTSSGADSAPNNGLNNVTHDWYHILSLRHRLLLNFMPRYVMSHTHYRHHQYFRHLYHQLKSPSTVSAVTPNTAWFDVT